MEPARVVEALERLYGHHDGDLGSWASAVTAAAYPLLQEGSIVGFTLFDTQRLYAMEMLGLSAEREQVYRSIMATTSAPISPESFDKTIRAQPMVSLYSHTDVHDSQNGALMQLAGCVDMLGLIGEPVHGVGLLLCAGLPATREIRSPERTELTRLAVHLEAAARARLRPETVIGTVSLEGRLELDARVPSRAAREEAVQQVGIIEDLRTTAHRQDGGRALSLWKALTTGSLSLLERLDTDGKRLYDLYENPPWRRDLRALTDPEAQVTSQAIRGLANKEIAYALGLGETYVSRLLGTAARKLGLPSGRALVRVASRLLAPPSAVALAELTPAEREVLRYLAAGYSNQQIAAERGVAQRTVANQVAAVLAKTGAGSRRGLLGKNAEPS